MALIYKYILVVLIVIELMIISVAMIIFVILRLLNIEFYIIYYLVFRVCERVLGITLLVLIVRYRGNDLYYTFNIRKI